MPVSKTKGKIAMLLSKYFLKLNNHNNLAYSTLTQILMNVTAPDPARVTDKRDTLSTSIDTAVWMELLSMPSTLIVFSEPSAVTIVTVASASSSMSRRPISSTHTDMKSK
jgi:hypothetical protein